MLRRRLLSWYQMASNLINKIDILATQSASSKSKRPIDAAEDDEFRVKTKRKKEREV